MMAHATKLCWSSQACVVSMFALMGGVQLAEALQHSDPKVPVDTVEVQKVGVCIRYCPLESAQGTILSQVWCMPEGKT